jgi:hypothetical protein
MLKNALTVILLFALAAVLPAAAQSENWQITGQSTAVLQAKPGFSTAYSGSNSLQGPHEYSRTLTATIYAGYRPWTGGELYFDPEMALGVPFSGLHGLGGFTNGEIARTSGADPVFYRARLFLRQIWGLGGGAENIEPAANQMAGIVAAERVVLTAGNLSALDIFDANRFSHDPRMGFLNWSLMAQGAWDFPADARGYTWGAVLEYVQPAWALRGGRFMLPKDSNGLPLNPRLLSSYGDTLEVERAYHLGAQGGRLRLLAFRNQAVMGAFADAAAQSAKTGSVPDVSTVRTANAKTGAGINIEQSLRDDVGLFLRGSANDGHTETYAFTEIDRSLSGGVVIKGAAWHRGDDEIGVAVALNGLSADHREYLARGGSGFFLGDGHLNYRQEQVLEAYYSLKVTRAARLSFDYQHIAHPGYNADRGPAHFFGLRLHTEI